jgi:CheY-like chemotaxis protein
VARVLVIHRKPAIAAERARRLCSEGLEAAAYPALGARAFREIRANPPDAILIDLTELPSYGRAMAVLLREQKATRNIPLVFLKGDPEKAARVREVLPDAAFAAWPDAAPAILRAIERAPQVGAAPQAAGISLARKLRIGKDATVAILEAPGNIRELLGPLPKGVRLEKKIDQAALILLFVKSAAALGRALPRLARQMTRGRTLWVCWPKRTSSMPCDLTLPAIRAMVSSYDLVDSKICAVDETWSGTAITKRRQRSQSNAARRNSGPPESRSR